MIETLGDLHRIMDHIATPLGTFRVGEDTPPKPVGYSLTPKWDMTGNNEQPPEYKGPFWLQFVLNAPDYTSADVGRWHYENGVWVEDPAVVQESSEWRGRKWRVSRHSTQREVVGTAFAAVLQAMEHEVREGFTWWDDAIFGPHIPLHALAHASIAKPDARNP